jgi:GTP cyclohydrolase II
MPAAHMLRSVGVSHLTLLTNNPAKTLALRKSGLDVIEQQPMVIAANPFNETYLSTKRQRTGHFHNLDRRTGAST